MISKLFNLLTKRKIVKSAYLAELENQASRDELTGLYNRWKFFGEIDRRKSRNDTGFALLMIDVDDMKQHNAFSHDNGDKVLRRLADILTRETRFEDIVARVGGDEFIIAADCTEISEVETMACRISERARAEGVAVTIGFALYQAGENTYDKASRALLQGKNLARGKVYMRKDETLRLVV